MHRVHVPYQAPVPAPSLALHTPPPSRCSLASPRRLRPSPHGRLGHLSAPRLHHQPPPRSPVARPLLADVAAVAAPPGLASPRRPLLPSPRRRRRRLIPPCLIRYLPPRSPVPRSVLTDAAAVAGPPGLAWPRHRRPLLAPDRARS